MIRIAIPRDGVLFEGHFPSRPILPGVAQIGLILDAIAREDGAHPVLHAIAAMRLRQLVFPGDELELDRRIVNEGLRFQLLRHGTIVSNGEFQLGSETFRSEQREALHCPGAEPQAGTSSPLLPHEPPMRFITRILAESANGLRCEARIPSGCGLACGKHAPAYACIEAAAQCAAAWEAQRRVEAGGPAVARLGYLVVMRGVEFFVEQVPTDEVLSATVVLRDAAMALSRYDTEVVLGSRCVVRAQIATMLTGP